MSDPVGTQVAYSGETEREVQGDQEEVDAECRPAVFTGQFSEARGKGEGGLGRVEVGGRVIGGLFGVG